MTDAELITRAAGGDRTAFQLLYERHWNAVYRFAWLLTKSVPDVEDIRQECFLALVRDPKRFDPVRAQFRTCLIAVARVLSPAAAPFAERDTGQFGCWAGWYPARRLCIGARWAD